MSTRVRILQTTLDLFNERGTATDDVALPLRGLVTGTGIGIAQFIVLQEKTDRAVFWVPVVAGAWALGWMIMRAISVDLTLHWSVFGAIGALTFQVLTGLALRWLLQVRPQVPMVA